LNARKYIEQQIQKLVDEAKPIASKAESEGRTLTTSERQFVASKVDQANAYKSELAELDANQAILDALGMSDKELGGSSENGAPVRSSLWLSAKARGLKPEPGQITRAMVSGDARGTKDLLLGGSSDVTGDAQANVPPRVEPGVSPLQVSQRYAHPVLPSANISPEDPSVSYLQQTNRTLADPDDALLDFASRATKPTTDSTVTLQNEPAKMVATVSGYIPNALFGNDDLRNVVDADMRLALNKSLDKYVVDAILSDPDTSFDGADIIEAIVFAQQKLGDEGFNPSVTLVSSTDYTVLTLMRSGMTQEFFLSNRPNLGDLRICDGIQDGSPVVLDPAAFGTLYTGPLAMDIDAFTRFDSNESRLRAEFPALVVVRRAKAACQVALSSL
jgi:hypothetical protein